MRSLPAKVNVTIKKGADFHMVCKVRNPKTHAAVPLPEGTRIESDIYDTIDTGLYLASFEVLDSNFAEGEFFLYLPQEVTASILTDAGVFDVFIKWPDQGPRKLMFQGKAGFTKEITPGPQPTDGAPVGG